LHWVVVRVRAALALVAVAVLAATVVSGGSSADPRTPTGLPGLPDPYLGTMVLGSGRLTAAIDAYGDVVDMRRQPAGEALIDNSAASQAAGSVAAETGIVPWVSLGGAPERPLWTADSVRQRYRPDTNMAVTVARFGSAWVQIAYAAGASELACVLRASHGVRLSLRSAEPAAARKLRCDGGAARRIVRSAGRADRRWVSRARPLGDDAPGWARRMYRRSLLVLRALTGRDSGAVAAGARDGWAYVWPRDAGATALAFAAAGYRAEAHRIARFLLGLDLPAAARFHGDGTPVRGRGAQGDAAGWVALAAQAADLPDRVASPAQATTPWQGRPDYQEGEAGEYLGNAVAAAAPLAGFESPLGLTRAAADPGSGLDTAAAWAVRPFPRPRFFPAARLTLTRLSRDAGRFGLVPGEAWAGGVDPWTAPTAWTAWGLAALGERQAALRLLADLRRAATPAGALPERVDDRTGLPRSTTPLAWSHAFAILALRQLWPSRVPVGN
jgi:hypothetical protein